MLHQVFSLWLVVSPPVCSCMVVSRYADVLREVAPHYGHEEKKMYFPYNYFPGCLPGSNNLFSH